MKKEFTPYEQALALKELGFDEPCICYYEKESIRIFEQSEYDEIMAYRKSECIKDIAECFAPLYQQAFRFFREKYNLFGFVLSTGERNYEWRIQNIKYLQDRRHFTLVDIGGGELNNTYEEAELECLKKLIEIADKNIKGEII